MEGRKEEERKGGREEGREGGRKEGGRVQLNILSTLKHTV
jgi:hypothetical protein